jgi:hypothetical protein
MRPPRRDVVAIPDGANTSARPERREISYLGRQDHGRHPLEDHIWNAHDVFVAASDQRSQNPGNRDA